MVGQGEEVFTRAKEGLRTWRAHNVLGPRVSPHVAAPAVGDTVLVTLGTSLVAIAAPCRIVAVIDEAHRFGFAYGTLPGHPERGEEAFVVTMDKSRFVRFEITAYSRPSGALTRLAGPIGWWIQEIATAGYLRAMRSFVLQGSNA
jgi:uncharacterized protein (UPF0548 family)